MASADLTIDAGTGGDRSLAGGHRGAAASVVILIARKLASLVLTLFLASLLVFFSRFLVPGDPVRFLLRGRRPSPDAVIEITRMYGLDLPPWQQYFNWITGILHGDFGRSLQYRQDVITVIGDRMPVTLLLVAMASVAITVLGLLAGIVAAVYRGRAADKVTLIALTILSALPSFVAAIVLITVFSVNFGWFPTFGAGQGFGDMLYHLTLPAITLTVVFVVVIAKVTRSAMIEQFAREHVEVATSRGIPSGAVVRRHVLRNAVRPIVTVSAPLVAGMLVATTIVDAAFGLTGLGSLLVQSVDRLDFPVVQAIVLLIVAVFLVTNTIVDLLEPIFDPRLAAGEAAR